eukprot:m.83370 g.83370  ORF g.83370 m.83370 type:complete len:248 (+) comp16341_c0_seq2:103-846(+)
MIIYDTLCFCRTPLLSIFPCNFVFVYMCLCYSCCTLIIGPGITTGVLEQKSTRRKRGSLFGRGSKRSSRSQKSTAAVEISGPTNFQHLSHLGYDDVAGSASVSAATLGDTAAPTPQSEQSEAGTLQLGRETKQFHVPAPPVTPPADSSVSVPPMPQDFADAGDEEPQHSPPPQQPQSLEEQTPDSPAQTLPTNKQETPVPTPRPRPVTAYDTDEEDFPPPPLAPPAPPPADDDDNSMDGFDDDEAMF